MAIEIRPFHRDDAQQLAEIVERCLREVNSRDYPADIIDKMCAHFTAQRLSETLECQMLRPNAKEKLTPIFPSLN